MQGTIVKVSGPLIVASGMAESKMYDVVRIGEQGLISPISPCSPTWCASASRG